MEGYEQFISLSELYLALHPGLSGFSPGCHRVSTGFPPGYYWVNWPSIFGDEKSQETFGWRTVPWLFRLCTVIDHDTLTFEGDTCLTVPSSNVTEAKVGVS